MWDIVIDPFFFSKLKHSPFKLQIVDGKTPQL